MQNSHPLHRKQHGLYSGSLTDVDGLLLGHAQDDRRPTGCSVVLCPEGAVAGVDVRGAAPGTRETDLLNPINTVQAVHAVFLTGGSAFGLDVAAGVMQHLETQGTGLDVGVCRVPIVSGAVLFDLAVGDPSIRPNAALGLLACKNALANNPAQGNVGAGWGVTVGKLYGPQWAMKGGLGMASICVGDVCIAAMVACNALGDVHDLDSGLAIAGALTPDRMGLRQSRQAMLHGQWPNFLLAGSNTTIGVIATNAKLGKVQATRLAQCGHDGLARSIYPVHTPYDGDTLFALSTGQVAINDAQAFSLYAMAAEVTARAVVNSALAASTLDHAGQTWLAASEFNA